MTAETAAGPVALRSDTTEAALLSSEAVGLVDAGADQQLAFAARWGRRLPHPGHGATAERWQLLATAGAVDLGLARCLEPHTDALAILDEAGRSELAADATWGVYAAEGPGTRLTARHQDGRWTLAGTKPWCSLAGLVSHALVTAWVDEDARGLFAVALREATATGERSPGVRIEEVSWVSRGLAGITSGPVTFTDHPAQPVGGPGWYLTRDGFAWGGMGVAAVWYGGAVGLARRLRRAVRERPAGPLVLAHLGAVDASLAAARAVLVEAAETVDGSAAAGAAGERLALRVRGVVADAVERVLEQVDHALGPGPLTQEEDYARRVADLRVYVRQHHPGRDTAALGRLVADAKEAEQAW